MALSHMTKFSVTCCCCMGTSLGVIVKRILKKIRVFNKVALLARSEIRLKLYLGPM